MMATNVATGLEIEGEDHIRPVTWEEWITVPIRAQDNAAREELVEHCRQVWLKTGFEFDRADGARAADIENICHASADA